MRWTRFAAFAAVVALAGCDGTGPGSGGTPGAGASSATPTPAPFVTATGRAGDIEVTIHPVMQDPTGACAAVRTTTPINQVSDTGCVLTWSDYNANSVPGQDVFIHSGMPTTVTIAAHTDTAGGGADATAFYRQVALEMWGLSSPELGVVRAVTNPAAPDNISIAVHNGQSVVSIPACFYPSAIRVVPLTTGDTSFLSARGLPIRSQMAIVATYPACAGVTMLVPTSAGHGSAEVEFGNPKANSVLIPGEIVNPAGMGPVWRPDAYLGCGNAQLSDACGA